MSCLDKLKEYINLNNNNNIYAYYPSGTLHFFKEKPSFAGQPKVNKPTLEEMEKDENYICSISINNIVNEFLSHKITFLERDGKSKKPMFYKSKSKGVKLYSEIIYIDYALFFKEFRSTDIADDFYIKDVKVSSVLNFESASKGDFLRIVVKKQCIGKNNNFITINVVGNPTVMLRKKRYINPIDRFLLNKLNIIDL